MDGGSFIDNFASSLALGVGIGAGFGLAKAYFSYFENKNMKVEVNMSEATHQKLEGLVTTIRPTNLTIVQPQPQQQQQQPQQQTNGETLKPKKENPNIKHVQFPCNRMYDALKHCVQFKKDHSEISCKLYYGLIEECLQA